MRLDRLEQAIAVMKRAGKVDMRAWQDFAMRQDIRHTEKELHACGNTACFAGWLAVSPEFQAAGGGLVENTGMPEYRQLRGSAAVIGWLEAEGPKAQALNLLIEGWGSLAFDTVKLLQSKGFRLEVEETLTATLVDWSYFKAQDVIKFLEALRD